MSDVFDSVLNFRCHKDLVARLERIAKLLRRRDPDLYRLALEDYAAAQEAELGLQPIEDSLMLHESGATKIPAKPPAKPATYKKKVGGIKSPQP